MGDTRKAKQELAKAMKEAYTIHSRAHSNEDARMHGTDLGRYCDRNEDFCWTDMLERFLKTFC